MRIVVFGAGSLGCALGGLLAKRHEVVLIGRKENTDAVRENGLRLEGEVEARVGLDARETVDGLSPPDLVVLTTKAYHTRDAVDVLSAAPWPDARAITLQNGLGNLEVLRGWKGAKAFGATTTMGASLVSPGNVRLSGLGRTVVGADLDEDGAWGIAGAFSACGLKVDVRRDIAGEIWAKAVVNCCINPLTAVLRVPNGKLLESEPVSRLMSDICIECSAVALAAGVALPEGRMIDRVRAVAEDTAGNRSSMLRDVELGRRTEIAQLNGAVCRVGSAHGIPTPLNRAVAAMVEALEPATVQ
ncbi:MAG: 2-dehydropantoate 2-reductase [Candidatus Thermoplasmatota archaeon]